MRVAGDSGTGKLNNQTASEKFCKDKGSVLDPYSFYTDPDPAFRQNNDPGPIQMQCFDDLKVKNIVEKIFKFVLDQKLQFTYP